MQIKKFFQAVSIAGIALFTAAGANAGQIIYNTNAAGTEFVSPVSGLTLDSSSGPAATLVFTPNGGTTTGTPSNIDLGHFDLYCLASNGCTTGTDSHFVAFTFDLIVTDTTDGATGEFIGTSLGGEVAINASTINVTWTPTQLGPGTTNTSSGNFGLTIFGKQQPLTSIVAPNSGSTPGDTTVQADISSATPEPASIGLIGAGLIGLAFAGRRKRGSR